MSRCSGPPLLLVIRNLHIVCWEESFGDGTTSCLMVDCFFSVAVTGSVPKENVVIFCLCLCDGCLELHSGNRAFNGGREPGAAVVAQLEAAPLLLGSNTRSDVVKLDFPV